MFYGLNVYSCKDVAEKFKGVKPLNFNVKYKIGGFYVQVFKLFHNVPNVGYLIDCPSGERIVFANDTTNVPYTFKNVNCLMIECNYDEDTIVDNMMNN